MPTGVPLLARPPANKRFTPPKPTAPAIFDGKKGFFDKLVSIPTSAAKAIGAGVAAIPTFVGKTAQTAVGFGEGIYDLALDAVNDDIYTSRFETDLQKARELGLEGDALVAYAAHRQYPLGSMIIESAVGTGRRFAEVATAGKYDFGQEGIDYARAFREGNLGALLVEDVGNVILAGRGAGLGNVVSRAGVAIGGRGGRLVETAGRLIEEPVATTTRGVAANLAPRIAETGRLGGLSDPFERIGQAEAPLRQAMSEIGAAYRARAEARMDDLTSQINVLRDQQRIAQQSNDMELAANIQSRISELDSQRTNAMIGSGLLGNVRRTIKRGKLAEERIVQTVFKQFSRLDKRGAVPETPETYRARAAKLREQAQRADDVARAEALSTSASTLEALADLKEQYPETLDGPSKPWMFEASVHVASGKARELAALEAQGMPMEQLVAAATDPYVDPTMAERGMLPTEDGVRAAIEFVKAIDGATTNLNPAEVYSIQAWFAAIRELSEVSNRNMARGVGMPEGPAPFYWFQPFPIPENLLTELGRFNQAVRSAVLQQLDVAAGQFIGEMYRMGLLDEQFFRDYNVDPQRLAEPGGQTGLFDMLVKRGLKEIADGDATPVPYMIAFNALKFSYKRLQQLAPQLMLNPDIYPAIMRPAVITRRQAIRQITGEDVLGLADQLADIARNNPDILPNALLDAIQRDIRRAIDPQTRIDQATWVRLRDRLSTIRRMAAEKVMELRDKADKLTTEERTLATRLIEVDQSLGAVEATLRTLAARAPEESPRLAAARERVATLEAERAGLIEERAILNEQLDEARQEQMPRLQQITDEISTLDQRIKELTDEQTKLDRKVDAHQRETKIIRDALERAPQFTDPETILPLMEDYNQILEFGETGPPEPVRITDQQVREAKRQAVEEAVGDVPLENLYADFDTLLGARKLKARARRKPDGSIDSMGVLDEDYIEYIRAILPNTKQRPWFKEFVDEYTAPDGEPLDTAVEQAAENYFGAEFQSSQTGETGARTAREFASIEDWLDTLARAYRRIKEAEERVKKAERRPLREYREDLELEQAGVLAEDSGFSRQSKTGLDIDDVRETALIILNGEAQALARIEENARKHDADNAARRSAEITEELRQARARRDELRNQPQITYDTAVLRRTGEINRRLIQIDRQLGRVRRGRQTLGPARRSLQFARQAEPQEAAREQARTERAQLRGVGRIRRPAPGAEGPAVGELTVGARNYINASVKQLNLQQKRNVARLKQVRQNIAEQERLVSEATTSETFASQTMREQADFGPALLPEGELPLYLPAGPPRSFFPGENFELGMRGEGAAPQTRLQSAQQRTSGAFVLDPGAMAARIAEVLGQQYRNSVIEEILRDPTVTQSVGRLLGVDRLEAVMAESEAAVAQQNIPRNTSEFAQAVQRDFGTKVLLELQRRGYEVATPVRVNPETFSHAPVGDLTLQARPNNIDANTLVMRRGLRERVVAEYERKGVREVPEGIRRVTESIGNLTARWKSHILPLSLRWQIGDAVGIVMFAWLRGDIPPKQLVARIREVVGRMTDPANKEYGAVLFSDLLGFPFADPVLAAAFGNGLQGRGLQTEDVRYGESLAARITGERPLVTERRIARPYNAFRAKAFRVNEAINSVGRAAVFIENLDNLLTEKGRSLDEITGPNSIGDPEISQAIRDAVDATNDTLGSFSDLNPWEKQVMRQVFPFWSWIKFINKAAYELAIDSPDRVLFYAHLGSMASDPDDMGLADWLRGKTPILGSLYDISFLNPYSDAILFAGNPLTDATETFTSLSPAIEVPRKIAGELAYAMTGREYPLLSVASRPGYLEGRPEASTRTLGDVLGGAAYIGVRGLVPIARNVFDILPTGTIPGTDIATGPVQRFGQGSARTTGAYAEPRLSPTVGRIGALLRTFGVPAPLISQETAQRQAAEQRQRDEAARLRRIVERLNAGG